ncbi:alpha/beta fold hydrolase [Nocardia fluminea]|uniref:alpha/beta fold hydrolase n=1 Tax=Nocardia fluminea TaxID=134984 RepID=UPI00379924C0
MPWQAARKYRRPVIISRTELATATVASMVCAAAITGCGPVEKPAPNTGLQIDFNDQTIAWHGCETGADDEVGRRLAAVGAQCGEFSAPLDYASPAGKTITVAVARRPAGDSARRIGTLVVETGGPGPSRDGIALLIDGPEGGHAAPDLAERYDLVGFDPRFFGASTPLECGWPTSQYLGVAQAAPGDRAGFDRVVAAARELALQCAPWQELLPHASTRTVARDLDLLRTLLGEPSLSYLGWSWGTYLGAVYAQMFGEHVERLVLDSPLDPRAAGPDLTRDTAPADAAALADWARWAAAQDIGLGTTFAAVLGEIHDLVDRVRDAPVMLAGITVTADLIPGLLLTIDDSAESYSAFGSQIRALIDASRGVQVEPPPTLAIKLSLYADTAVTPEFGFSATVANQCADRPARPVEDYFADIELHHAEEPLFGALARHLGPCAMWPVSPNEPPTEIDNQIPALLVGADGDPVAPSAGLWALRTAMPAARSLTLRPASRHGVYLFDSSACIDDTVTAYLLDGVLPSGDTTCDRAEP